MSGIHNAVKTFSAAVEEKGANAVEAEAKGLNSIIDATIKIHPELETELSPLKVKKGVDYAHETPGIFHKIGSALGLAAGKEETVPPAEAETPKPKAKGQTFQLYNKESGKMESVSKEIYDAVKARGGQ